MTHFVARPPQQTAASLSFLQLPQRLEQQALIFVSFTADRAVGVDSRGERTLFEVAKTAVCVITHVPNIVTAVAEPCKGVSPTPANDSLDLIEESLSY